MCHATSLAVRLLLASSMPPTNEKWISGAVGHNFVWPAEVRARLDPKAQELTRWQQWARWDY
eukprot:SAG31_NODE_844_length_11549_cov_2.985852_12_plen_62_part_00